MDGRSRGLLGYDAPWDCNAQCMWSPAGWGEYGGGLRGLKLVVLLRCIVLVRCLSLLRESALRRDIRERRAHLIVRAFHFPV